MKRNYMAESVYDKTRGLAAFTLDQFNVVKVRGNQWGRRYTYKDGSAIFIGRDLSAKLFYPGGFCMAARIGPGGRYTETALNVAPDTESRV